MKPEFSGYWKNKGAYNIRSGKVSCCVENSSPTKNFLLSTNLSLRIRLHLFMILLSKSNEIMGLWLKKYKKGRKKRRETLAGH